MNSVLKGEKNKKTSQKQNKLDSPTHFSLRKKLFRMRKGGKLLSLEKSGRIGFMKQLEIVLHCNLQLV